MGDDIPTTNRVPARPVHIAHRRLPLELTTLMMEQLNLQRQLDAVQQQQQQILAQQQQMQQHLPVQPLPRGHQRTGLGSHRRLPLFQLPLGPTPALGHNRRHLLGINEAKKAAAIAQQQRLPLRQSSTPIEDRGQLPPLFRFPNEEGALQLPRGFLFPLVQVNPPDAPPAAAPPGLLQHQHRRLNLRNYDPNTSVNINTNWRAHQRGSLQLQTLQTLEPPAFVPGHRLRGLYGGLLVLLMQTFVGGQGGNQGGQQRKLLFAPYLPQLQLPELIADGRLVVGTLRVNKKNRLDAYVLTDGLLDADVFICGLKDRNRALEGDLVAVELLVVDEVWGLKREKEEKKRRKDQAAMQAQGVEPGDDIRNDATGIMRLLLGLAPSDEPRLPGVKRRGSLKQRPTQKKNDDVEVEGQLLLLVEEEEINDEFKPLYAGHVVAVVDRIPGQLFAGTLGLLRPLQAQKEPAKNGDKTHRPKIVWFKPTDKKVPLIAIPTEQAPRDFVENHELYANRLFVALIKRWPITSLHPFGTLVLELGEMDGPETDIDAILRDNNFLCDEYPDLLSKRRTLDFALELPLPLYTDRREFTDEFVLSFAPTGLVADHALHVKRLLQTLIELGFHVADVTHFVTAGLVLDKKAKKRSLLVFLAQRTTPMLPDSVNAAVLLAENKRGMALLVVFEIDTATFEVSSCWMGELVVVPWLQVTYDQVDAVLRGESVGLDQTRDYIRMLALIAREFRRQRLNNKQLETLPALALLNQLDDEKVRLDLDVFAEHPALLVVDEIAHKVNHAVAQRVHAQLGDRALLRRHPLPTLLKIELFAKRVLLLGVPVDTSTLTLLQNLILAIADPVQRSAVQLFLYKAMLRGRYIVAGRLDAEQFQHYYLNLPLYTHFTAPTRRYADLIVHRQLKAVLTGAPYAEDVDALKMTADYCNFKKDCAFSAQEQLVHLLLLQTINNMATATGQLLCMGTVLQVYELAFDVFIPEFGIEKRVHGDQLPLVKAEFDKLNRVLELYWERGVDLATWVPADERQPLLYRNSIKNKFRTLLLRAAKHQTELGAKVLVLAEWGEKLALLGLALPQLRLPPGADTDHSLAPYTRGLRTRTDDLGYVQEIRELEQVPVLLRAEIGMALPCLTVRALNPFAEA